MAGTFSGDASFEFGPVGATSTQIDVYNFRVLGTLVELGEGGSDSMIIDNDNPGFLHNRFRADCESVCKHTLPAPGHPG